MCGATDIAPEYSTDELVGEWGYLSSTLVEDGYSYYAEANGTLALGADGTWEGSRELYLGAGGGTDPMYPGPGTWDYDGSTFTLAYDDGSDTETYSGVLVSDFVDSVGVEFRALTLEQAADGDDCTVLLLRAES